MGLQENLLLSYLFSFNTCFWCPLSSSGSEVFCSCVPLDLYSGNCFDQVVVLFNSRICVNEFSLRVDFENFVSEGVVSHFFLPSFLYLFTREYSLCLCVCVGVRVHVYVYIFVFFLLSLFFFKIIFDS